MPYRIRALYVWALLLIASPTAFAIDSRENIERAVQLIEAGDYDLARAYLEPALIDFRITPAERSRAYYLRGYSYFAQEAYVSAGKDYNRALEFNPGNPVVLAALGHLLYEGLGVEANPALAVALFEQAAEADNPAAKLRLGHAYLRGVGVVQNVGKGRRWLGEAAAAGLAPAMMHLAQSYRAPLTDDPDPEQAKRWLQKAHEAGAPDALAYLGFMAEGEELGEPDPVAARDYFAQAAEAGSALAQAKLGHLYLTGDGVDSDPAEAERLFRLAAQQQHPTGYMGLAYLYETGTGVAADPAEAEVWYRRAADAGLMDAQLRLVYAGLRQGDLAGHQRAARWLTRAAAQNNVQALNDYAWLLATSPFDPVRNGQQALTLALQAVSHRRSPVYLDTLAAAYAEAGKFDRAVATQQEALALVDSDDAALRAELESHLEAFEDGKPWRE